MCLCVHMRICICILRKVVAEELDWKYLFTCEKLLRSIMHEEQLIIHILV